MEYGMISVRKAAVSVAMGMTGLKGLSDAPAARAFKDDTIMALNTGSLKKA